MGERVYLLSPQRRQYSHQLSALLLKQALTSRSYFHCSARLQAAINHTIRPKPSGQNQAKATEGADLSKHLF